VTPETYSYLFEGLGIREWKVIHGSRDKLFTWTKVVCPTRVTLFRKQGVPTARVTLPAETSWKLSI
jgi:hypothetical protein